MQEAELGPNLSRIGIPNDSGQQRDDKANNFMSSFQRNF